MSEQNPTVKEDIEAILYDTKDLVTEHFALTKDYALSAFAMANQALTDLKNTARKSISLMWT